LKLRQKIVSTILPIMAIVFVMVMSVAIMDIMGRYADEQQRPVILDGFVEKILSRPATDQTSAGARVREFTRAVSVLDFVEGWLVTQDGAPVAWHRSERLTVAGMKRLFYNNYFNYDRRGVTVAGVPYNVHVRVAGGDVGAQLKDSLLTYFLVMVAGTIFLCIMLYGLLSRLVVRPIERLADTTRKASAGAFLSEVPVRGGNDEIAQLGRSYNAMVKELNGFRADLTKKVEEARREMESTQRQLVVADRLAATGKLAAGIAHEINNPLAGMINAARTIEKGAALEGKNREYLGLITEGLARVQDTVKKILQFQKHEVVVAKLDIAGPAESAVSFAEHRLREKRVSLSNTIRRGAFTVMGSATEIQQVFLNLILNAADAVADGGTIELLAGAEGDDEVAASVKDDGCGMDEATRAAAFDLFFTTKGGTGGSGLGLAIVHHIVTSHGGRVEIESAPGEGTEVRIVLQRAGD